MAEKNNSASLSGGKKILVLAIFAILSFLIVFGLNKVIRKTKVIPVNVSLSDYDVTVGVGITKKIEANGGKSFAWSSSNEKVATVSADGSVQGVKPGSCDLSVENEFGRTTQCHVTVKKTVYLTIDDCPMGYTGEILNILKKYDVKATFFVMNTYNNRMLKKIQEDGHCIGLHTYTHTFKKCYRSQYSYFADLEKLSDIVEGYTGTRPNIIRFPGGTGNHVGGKLNMRRMVNGVEDLGYRDLYDS